MGVLRWWWIGTGCNPVASRLRAFESLNTH